MAQTGTRGRRSQGLNPSPLRSGPNSGHPPERPRPMVAAAAMAGIRALGIPQNFLKLAAPFPTQV